jgi:type I restriction enzyme S subunit
MVITAQNIHQKPGYKQTEVGAIPEDWNTEILECVCIPGGLVRGPFGGSLKKEFFTKDGFKVYEQRNAIYRDADLGSYFISEDKYKELRRFEVSEGDFIISCSGTIGKIFQVPKNAKAGIINQALLKIKTDSHVIHDQFFFYIFDWDKFQQRIIDNTQGGAMQNLVGMDIFRTIPIPLPPLPEQQAIATALSDVDALITSLDKLIAKKRDIKQATMQQLLTGKMRLPGFSQVWEVKKLGEILRVRHGKSQSGIIVDDGKYPILATSGEIGRTNTYLYDKPSVLIGRKGTIDSPQYMDTPFWTIDTLFYTEILEWVHPKFVFYLFNMIGWLKYNEASGVPSLNASTIESIEVQCPLFPEQRAIASILSDMDAEITALEKKRDKTRALKLGMMQELLTGKTRLV